MKKFVCLFFLLFLLTACSKSYPTAKSPPPSSLTTDNKPVYVGPVVTGFTDGAVFTVEPIVVRGKAPKGAERVLVNGSEIKSFKPGDTDFAYKTTTELGNLVLGQNIYKIQVYDSAGIIGEQDVKVDYQPKSNQ